MTQDEIFLQQLRDCFSTGYSMPLWCVYKNYKRPLFVAYDQNFLWELYVQFSYSKINDLNATFMMFKQEATVNYSQVLTLRGVSFSVFNGENTVMSEHDVIIFLTVERQEINNNKILYLNNLVQSIANYVFFERPIYNYIKLHPGVKVITYSAPRIVKNEHMSEQEKIMFEIRDRHIRNEILKNKDSSLPIKTPLDYLGYTNEQVFELLSMPQSVTDYKGCTKFTNYAGGGVNFSI